MTKRIKNKRLDPGRYGMILCPECKGKGKFLDQDEKVCVCSVCGGFGLIKKENNVSDQSLIII
jgi:DnaJ-class molecular chaperone